MFSEEVAKSKFEGATRGSEHHTKLTLASKESGKPLVLTSVNETTLTCSSQHVNQEVKDISLSRKSSKQNFENMDSETIYVYSTSQRNMEAKTDISKLLHPKKRGERSARPRRNNSTAWVPLKGFTNSEKDVSKYGNDHNFGSKKMISAQGGNISCSAAKTELELMENSCKFTNVELQAIKKDIGERIDPKKHEKRSARPRGKKPASCISLDGLQNFERELNKHVNDQIVGSNKMKSTYGSTTIDQSSKMVAKVKKNSGADINVNEQADAPMIDGLAEVKEIIGADPDNHTSTITTDTVEVIERNREDAITTEQMDVLMNDTIDELMVRNGTDTNCVVQDGVSPTDTLADVKGSNGATANVLVQTSVRTSDVVYPQQGKANNAEIHRTIFSGLNLDIGAEHFDLSCAESSLASLYGQSKRDSCIEFAVKLLMDVIPLPKEAAEAKKFFSQKMNSEKSTNPGPPEYQERCKPLKNKNPENK